MKVQWQLGLPMVVLGSIGLGGCSTEDRCIVGDGDAQVCVTGNLEIKPSGLAPGSQLILTTDSTGKNTYLVGDDGMPDGQVGLLGDFAGQTLSIAATAASGMAFEGEIGLDD